MKNILRANWKISLMKKARTKRKLAGSVTRKRRENTRVIGMEE